MSNQTDTVPVMLDTFIRAESDLYFSRIAQLGFGRFSSEREPAAIDRQEIVRLNRDTLYSSAVFDLAAGPVTITLPDPGDRFMAMQIISQDHYTVEVVYAPGQYTYTQEKVGTRYVAAAIRTLIDPRDPADLQAVHALQDAIKVEQAGTGQWEAPNWDMASQAKIRGALVTLGSVMSGDLGAGFGPKGEVDPVVHLIGTAIGWGGNPPKDATYLSFYPEQNDGETAYALTVRDVPVDGFWSVTVYNEQGYFEKNDDDLYSLNSFTATPDADGTTTIQFGGNREHVANWLPVMPGWNYMVRLYRPRPEILDGTWEFPQARTLSSGN